MLSLFTKYCYELCDQKCNFRLSRLQSTFVPEKRVQGSSPVSFPEQQLVIKPPLTAGDYTVGGKPFY